MSNVCCLFSPLLRKVFLRVLRSGYSALDTPVLPSSQKLPPFRNSNSSRNHQLEEEPLSGCTTSKSLFRILTVINYFIYLYSIRSSSPFFPAPYLNTQKKANLTMGLVGLNPSRGGTGACGWKNVSPICASLLFLIPQATKPTWPEKLLSKIWHITNVNIF